MKKLAYLAILSSICFSNECFNFNVNKIGDFIDKIDQKCYNGYKQSCECFILLRNKFAKDCKNGDVNKCEYVGMMYSNTLRNVKFFNYEKSAYFYEIVCNKNKYLYCELAGFAYEKAYRKTKDKKYLLKAKVLYKKACDNNIDVACNYYNSVD